MTDSRLSLVRNDAFFTCQSGDVCVIILIVSVWKQCSDVWLLMCWKASCGYARVHDSVFLCAYVCVWVSVCVRV